MNGYLKLKMNKIYVSIKKIEKEFKFNKNENITDKIIEIKILKK